MSQTKAQLIDNLVQALNFTGVATAPANGLFLSASNTLKLSTASTERLKIDGTEVVFNETGASVDFRVEGDNAVNLLKVDASADKVGIGVASPIEILHANGAVISTGSSLTGTTTGTERAILDLTSNQARVGHFRGGASAGSGKIGFYTESLERARIDTTGNFLSGMTCSLTG